MLDERRNKEYVQNRRMATSLTDEENENFKSDWESQQQIREELKEKSHEIWRYENTSDTEATLPLYPVLYL
mgnify:CR=1 FL=1